MLTHDAILNLVRLHLELECKGINEQGRVFEISCANPDGLHRVYVTRHAFGECFYFKEGLPEPLIERLRALPLDDYFFAPERVKAVLEDHAPVDDIFIGKSYVFPDTIPPEWHPDVTRLSMVDPAVAKAFNPNYTPGGSEVFVIVADGKIVSACESSRENKTAAEAWVHTLEEYRRRGYARQVTAAWASALKQQGKTPFYSHLRSNLASQSVAESLDLFCYIEDAGYS